MSSILQVTEYENWDRIHSIWVATSILFLLWQIHFVIETILRANTVSNIRKRGYTLISSTETGTSTVGGIAATERARNADVIPTDWMIRVRHGGRLARNAFLSLMFLTLFVQFWMIRAKTTSKAPLPPPLPTRVMDGNQIYWAIDAHSLFIFYAFSWVVAAITLFQVVMYLIIEPFLSARDDDLGYEDFGAGVYGRRRGHTAWMDFFFEIVKFVSIAILVITGLSLSYDYYTL